MAEYAPKTEDYEKFSQVSLARGVIRLFLRKLNEHEKCTFRSFLSNAIWRSMGKGLWMDIVNELCLLCVCLTKLRQLTG